jgi:hypothetical protein
MKILSALNDRRSRPAAPSHHSNGASDGEARPPVPGYDRLKTRRVIADLPRRSQTELAAIEDYERAHDARPEVLNKLRYLRGSEPLPGYDTLSAEEISAALDDADPDTLTSTREYERKFHRRQPVLDELARLRHERASSPEGVPGRGAPAV